MSLYKPPVFKERKPNNCPYCDWTGKSLKRHLNFCKENPDNQAEIVKKKDLEERIQKLESLIENIMKTKEINYEKFFLFVLANKDMIDTALDESIKQYRNKNPQKVVKYKRIKKELEEL